MTFSILLLLVFRVVMTGCAVLLAVWVKMPIPGLVGLGLSGFSSLFTTTRVLMPALRTRRAAVSAAWFFSLVVIGSALWSKGEIWDGYYGVIAWCIAGATALAANATGPGPTRVWWKRLSATWAALGVWLWLGWAYMQNLRGQFLAGLALAVAVLVALRIWFRLGSIGIQVVNSVILFCTFLPLFDVVTGLHRTRGMTDEVAGNGYSYEVDKGDPALFREWQNRSCRQLELMGDACIGPDPTHVLPYRLRPNTQATFFQSRLQINSLGFRGREITREKGNAYRIVALGESTTFGLGLLPDYRPWPELLEQMIRERLKPDRPVEVINAGVPGFSIENNVRRLRSSILPLKPDMIISYHGWNGFHFFSDALPQVFGKNMPIFKPRPIKLLAKCEYRLKMLHGKHLLMTQRALSPQPVWELMETRYAKGYEGLIDAAQRNHIHLVLANYSMAVNAQSLPEVVGFYREGFPALYWQIEANRMHTRLVDELARLHPAILRVDTHPALDGKDRFFIDSMHFTQEGDRMLAETMFKNIEWVLREDLSIRDEQQFARKTFDSGTQK